MIIAGVGPLIIAGGGPLIITGGGPLIIAGGGPLIITGGGPLIITGGDPLIINGGGPLIITGVGPLIITRKHNIPMHALSQSSQAKIHLVHTRIFIMLTFRTKANDLCLVQLFGLWCSRFWSTVNKTKRGCS